MKRIFFLVAIFSFLFSSCIFVNDNSGQEPDNPPVDENTALVTFENKSKFDVNIYLGSNPYIGAVSCTVPASSTNYSKAFIISKDQSIGDVFYIEYLIKIGNALFPYWTHEASSGWKSQAIKKGENNKIIIDELTKCESKSAYLLIENNTNSEVRVNNGTTPLKPYASSEALISKQGGCGIYEVSPLKLNECSDINLGYLQGVKIKIDITNEFPLPLANSDVTAGNIYTISVNKDEHGVASASLKSVTPFNIDTQKKIWSLDNSIFTTEFPTAMRLSYDKKSTLIMGTAKTDIKKIGIACIDEYGKYSTGTDNFISFTNANNLLYTSIVDFVEQDDGSIVMLCRQVFEADDIPDTYVIACYDFNKDLKWQKSIPSSAKLNNGKYYKFHFRSDTRNKLVQIEKDKFAFVGIYNLYSKDDNDYYSSSDIYYLITYIDGTDVENKIVKSDAVKYSRSSDCIDALDGLERHLTSAYFDGSDLYICGYDNWTPADYSTTHVGKVWKAPLTEITSGTFDFSSASNVVYSCENCLFFGIDGNNSNGKASYVVCGEYKDSGKLLKGCFVTSDMIKGNSSCEPVLYTVKEKNHCWFNQLCQYGNKILLCGKSGDSFDGNTNPLPFVVAFDYNGNKLWENLTYTSYTDALNILPNSIGTYLLQLGSSKGDDNKIHYVNADLLGNEAK